MKTMTIPVGKYGDQVEFILEYECDGEKIFWARDPFCMVRHLHRIYRSREEAIIPSNIGIIDWVLMNRTLHASEALARYTCRCGFQFVMSEEQIEADNLPKIFANRT